MSNVVGFKVFAALIITVFESRNSVIVSFSFRVTVTWPVKVRCIDEALIGVFGDIMTEPILL